MAETPCATVETGRGASVGPVAAAQAEAVQALEVQVVPRRRPNAVPSSEAL